MPSKTNTDRSLYYKEYAQKNRERLRLYQREWAKNNRDKERLKSAKYLAKNKEKNALKSQKRRALEKQRESFLILDREVKRLYSRPCANCSSKDNITLDHIVPLFRGGRHSVGNLQPLCKSCNSQKQHRTIMEWRLGRSVSRV